MGAWSPSGAGVISGTSSIPSASASGQIVDATSTVQIASINATGLPGYATLPSPVLTTMKGDNATNEHTALQNLVTYLSAVFVATGVPQIIYCPAGIYQIRDNGTVWATGVGLVGDGQGSTIFRLSNPVNTTNPTPLATFTAANNSASVTNYLSNLFFKGFTIDGSGVALASYNVGAKGLAIQYVVQSNFEDILIQNCGATGFGVDYMVSCFASNVDCYNNGRLWVPGTTYLGGAGLGIGVGGWAGGGSAMAEGAVFVGCDAIGNGTHGLFLELQNNAWPLPIGYRVVGGRYQGNQFGISDWGCQGLVVSGCDLTNNSIHGFNVNANGTGATAGAGGLVTGCTIDGNGLDGVAIGDSAGKYTVTGNRISNNGRHGWHSLNVVNSASTGIATLSVTDNDIWGQGRSGIYVDALLNNPFIIANRVRDNGIAAGAIVSASTTSVYTALTITDSGQAWAAGSQVGKTVTVGAQTATVKSNTATVLTLWPYQSNGTTAWSTGTPANATAYSLPAAATDRAGMTFNQGVNHPVVRDNRFMDDNGVRIQPYGWVITSSGTCSSGSVTDNDLLGNLTASYLFTTAPSGGTFANNAGLAAGTVGSATAFLVDAPLQVQGLLTATGQFATVPPTNATIQTALGNLILGTAYQNTLTYDVRMTVYLSITVNTSGVVALGVGPTNTPTQRNIVSGVTTVGFVPITFKIPAGQYALLSISGTVTDSIAGQYLEAA